MLEMKQLPACHVLEGSGKTARNSEATLFQPEIYIRNQKLQVKWKIVEVHLVTFLTYRKKVLRGQLQNQLNQ